MCKFQIGWLLPHDELPGCAHPATSRHIIQEIHRDCNRCCCQSFAQLCPRDFRHWKQGRWSAFWKLRWRNKATYSNKMRGKKSAVRQQKGKLRMCTWQNIYISTCRRSTVTIKHWHTHTVCDTCQWTRANADNMKRHHSNAAVTGFPVVLLCCTAPENKMRKPTVLSTWETNWMTRSHQVWWGKPITHCMKQLRIPAVLQHLKPELVSSSLILLSLNLTFYSFLLTSLLSYFIVLLFFCFVWRHNMTYRHNPGTVMYEFSGLSCPFISLFYWDIILNLSYSCLNGCITCSAVIGLIF